MEADILQIGSQDILGLLEDKKCRNPLCNNEFILTVWGPIGITSFRASILKILLGDTLCFKKIKSRRIDEIKK